MQVARILLATLLTVGSMSLVAAAAAAGRSADAGSREIEHTLEIRLDAARDALAAGRTSRAIAELTAAEELAAPFRDPAQMSTLRGLLGQAYLLAGQIENAREALESGLRSARAAGLVELEAAALNDLGSLAPTDARLIRPQSPGHISAHPRRAAGPRRPRAPRRAEPVPRNRGRADHVELLPDGGRGRPGSARTCWHRDQGGRTQCPRHMWMVYDPAAAVLVPEFYRHLRDPRVSKAEALRRAQLAVLQDERLAHPAYWAPYLMIGNWL
jgi:hypothetical protein